MPTIGHMLFKTSRAGAHPALMLRISFTLSLAMSFLLSACSSQTIDLPTLAPTSRPISTLETAPTLTEPLPTVASTEPTDNPTASDVPTVTTVPTGTPFLTATTVITLAPPLVVKANGSTTITLSAEQLNDALARRFTASPLPGYTAPPHVTIAGGQVRLDLSITPQAAAPTAQPIALTLSVAALNTTTGSVLDVRATSVSALNGITTQQVKRSQALLKATLEDIAQRTVGSSTLVFTYVSITPNTISLTVAIP